MSAPRPELMALLAACKQQPDEDAPRLVLADWLDEHGNEADRARAQVVRLQLAAERGEVPFGLTVEALVRKYLREWLGPARANFPKLPDCERGLLRAYGPKVAEDRAGVAGSEEWAWVERAGFSSVRLLNAPLLATVTGMELTCHGIGPAALRALAGDPGLDRLRSLTLNWWLHERVALHDLFLSPHAAGLGSLTVSTCPLGAEGAEVLASSASLAGLRRLCLSSCGLGDEGAAHLARSTVLGSLRALELHSSEIGGAGLSALCDAEGLAGLRALLVGFDDVSEGTEALGRAAFRGALEVLELVDGGLPNGLPPLPRLRRLDLSYNDLRAPAMAQLAEALPSGLESLRLTGNPIGPKGMDALAATGAAPRALHLEACRLGDRGAKRLAAWPGLASVEWLSLGSNDIGPKGVRALVESPHLERLTALDLGDNPLEESGGQVLAASLMARLRWLSVAWAEPCNGLAEAFAARPAEGLRELVLTCRTTKQSARAAVAKLRRALPDCILA